MQGWRLGNAFNNVIVIGKWKIETNARCAAATAPADHHLPAQEKMTTPLGLDARTNFLSYHDATD